MAKRMRLIADDEFQKRQNKILNSVDTSPSSIKNHFFQDDIEKSSDLLHTKGIPDDLKVQLYGSLMNVIKNQLNEILQTPVKVIKM